MARTSVYVSERRGGSMASDAVLLSETPATWPHAFNEQVGVFLECGTVVTLVLGRFLDITLDYLNLYIFYVWILDLKFKS